MLKHVIKWAPNRILSRVFQFDQLAQQVIRFVVKYTRGFGGYSVDREKVRDI